MTFRRSSQKNHDWKRWLASCRKQLIDTGVPSGVYESENFWFYFMDHGEFPGIEDIPSFQLTQLSVEQAKSLLCFLQLHAQLKDSTAQRDLEIHIEKILDRE
jgi:hypothetical protein